MNEKAPQPGGANSTSSPDISHYSNMIERI